MKFILTARKILAPILLGLITLMLSSAAYAACTSPSGNEGDLRYYGGNLRYCLGNNTWRIILGTASGACATPGEIKFDGTHLRFCKGATWYWVNSNVLGNPGSTSGAGCGIYTAGQFYYDTARDFYVYCDGSSAWDFY